MQARLELSSRMAQLGTETAFEVVNKVRALEAHLGTPLFHRVEVAPIPGEHLRVRTRAGYFTSP